MNRLVGHLTLSNGSSVPDGNLVPYVIDFEVARSRALRV